MMMPIDWDVFGGEEEMEGMSKIGEVCWWYGLDR